MMRGEEASTKEVDVGEPGGHLKGESLETRVQQLEDAIALLLGDSKLANLPYGTLKDARSHLALRSIGGSGGAYPAGLLPVDAAVTTAAFGVDTLWAIPFYLPGIPNLVAKIGVSISTASAGNIRLGIYADKGEALLYPGKLLLDAGAIDTSTTGVKSITVRQELPRGLVWVCMNKTGGGVSQISIAAGSHAWTPQGWSEVGTTRYVKIYKSSAYGVLPDPFPAGGTESGGVIPYIFLKFGTYLT